MSDPMSDLARQLADAPVAGDDTPQPEGPSSSAPPPGDGDPGPRPDPDRDGGGRSRDRSHGEIWPGCPVRALGTNDGVFFYLNRLGEMRAISKHDGQSIMSLFLDRINLLCLNFPTHNKDGDIVPGRFNQQAACIEMMRATAEKGLFNPSGTVRGTGAWVDDNGALIYHCGKALLIGGEEVQTGDIDGKIYPAYPAIPAPAPPDSRGDPAPDILAQMHTWAWQRPDIDPMLALGMVGILRMGGALDWRPVFWASGDRAAGKSTFQDMLRHLLGGDKGVIKSADATKSGITSQIGHSSLPVLLDEVEPGDDDGKKEKALVDLARIAASGDQWLRGSADQKGASGNVYSAFLFSSILIPGIMRPADRSRLIILGLDRLPDDAPKPVIDPRTWRARGARLTRILIERWPTWDERLDLWRDAFAEAGLHGRDNDNYATCMAMADMALHEALPSADELRGWAAKIAKLARHQIDEVGADAEDMIQHLLGQPYDVYRRGEMFTVAHWIMTAAALPAAPRELVTSADAMLEPTDADRTTAAKRANEKLAKAGLRVSGAGEHARLFISSAPVPGLLKLFETSRWSRGVWSQSVRRLPGSAWQDNPLRLAGQRVRGYYIPLTSIGGLLDFPMDRAPVERAPMSQTPDDFEDYL